MLEVSSLREGEAPAEPASILTLAQLWHGLPTVPRLRPKVSLRVGDPRSEPWRGQETSPQRDEVWVYYRKPEPHQEDIMHRFAFSLLLGLCFILPLRAEQPTAEQKQATVKYLYSLQKEGGAFVA